MTERQKGGNIDTRYDYQPRNQDVQYRHSLRQGDDEWTWGAETARMDNHTLLASYSSLNTNYGPLATQLRDDVSAVDKSLSFYLADRRLGKLLVDAGLHYQEYDKTSSRTTQVVQNDYPYGFASGTSITRQGVYPRLGLAWTPAADEVWRLAWQKWLRPIASNTLSPVASAGIALDDQVVLPGGELERLRFQFERELTPHTYAALFLDAKQINNLGQPGDVLNQREEIADLDRLRNRAALVFQSNGEALEETPAFLQGRIKSAGASLNQRLADHLSAFANYVYSDSENTHPWFAGFELPYLPRHHLTLGGAWVGPQRLQLQAAAIYRTRRFSNEENSAELAAGWDAALKANWQSADKRWLVEGYAMNMLKNDTATTVGVNAVWRY